MLNWEFPLSFYHKIGKNPKFWCLSTRFRHILQDNYRVSLNTWKKEGSGESEGIRENIWREPLSVVKTTHSPMEMHLMFASFTFHLQGGLLVSSANNFWSKNWSRVKHLPEKSNGFLSIMLGPTVSSKVRAKKRQLCKVCLALLQFQEAKDSIMFPMD